MNNNGKKINIALAGQGNSGKSVVFNCLTGLHQHIGNWSGTTIEKCEGTLFYKGYTFDVLDLPGLYSFTTYSEEEVISRDYIINHKPDCVVNVIDATVLERSLIFTLQLLELGCPLVVVLNMYDLAKKKGLSLHVKKLEQLLGVPVITAVATRGYGISGIADKAIELAGKSHGHKGILYGKEIESCIRQLSDMMKGLSFGYPDRWVAIKLLEKDPEVLSLAEEVNPALIEKALQLSERLENIHGHDSSIVIADERSHISCSIAREGITAHKRKLSFNDKLDAITTDKFAGYIIMIIILGSMFLSVFLFGNWLSGLFDTASGRIHSWWDNTIGMTVAASLVWSAIESVLALIQIALPYILPFYIILYLLEDWGYIARISFLMDSFMHKMGIHGKACIPFIIGFGCNVPGCLACRIMESKRERFITAVLVTLVPCSAMSVIIFGLVGKYVGLLWAFGLYVLSFLVVLIVGKISSRLMLGEPVELIMPMPDYKTPQVKTIMYQTWNSLKDFVYIAAPIVVVAGILIHAIDLAGWMPAISSFLNPVTVTWLGLPAVTGILLIFGILRKELVLVMLAAFMGTTDFVTVLTSQQMITLAVVSMFYVPCIATVSVLWKEYGWKKALAVCFAEIFLAIVFAGLVSRILKLFF